MATEFVPHPLVGGLNLDSPSDSIRDGEVADANNFIFNRGRMKTRFGVTSNTLSGTGILTFARYIAAPYGGGFVGALYYFMHSSANVVRFYIQGTGEITGAGTYTPMSSCVVNAAILFANQINISRYMVGAATYTVIAKEARYVTGFNARAITGGEASYANRVSWSVVGDETDFVGVGSGHTDLSDSATWIGGLGVLNDTLVICRPDGFHFGYPTGQGAMPYRFESRTRDGIGVHPWTRPTFFDDTLFFVGADDVYLLSGQGLKSIGGTNKNTILGYINNGVKVYECYATTRFSGETGVFLHLIPHWTYIGASPYTRALNQRARLPHLVYNLVEDKWMKFYYPGYFEGGFPAVYTDPSGPISSDVVSRSLDFCIGGEGTQQYYTLDSAVSLEEEAWVQSKTFLIGSPTRDMTLRRALLRYRDTGAHEVKVECSADLNENRWGQEQVVAIGGKNDGKWKRKWVNLQGMGNDFEYRITVPPGNHLETNMIGGMYEPAPEYQGS